jgi:hypothetical protein
MTSTPKQTLLQPINKHFMEGAAHCSTRVVTEDATIKCSWGRQPANINDYMTILASRMHKLARFLTQGLLAKCVSLSSDTSARNHGTYIVIVQHLRKSMR